MKKFTSLLLILTLVLSLCAVSAAADNDTAKTIGEETTRDMFFDAVALRESDESDPITRVFRSSGASAYTSYATDELSLDYYDATLYEGAWKTFDNEYSIALPTDWYTYEVTEDEKDFGILYSFGKDDWVLNISWITASSMSDLGVKGYDDLIEVLNNQGFTGIGVYEVNDFPYPVVTFWNPDSGNFFAVFADGKGGMNQLCFMPATDEAFQPYIANILYSLSSPVG